MGVMRRVLLAFMAMAPVGCRDGGQVPARLPASLEVVSDLPGAGVVGELAGSFVVRVTDANGQPLPDVIVHFAPIMGAARVDPARVTTDGSGVAQSMVTLSTTPGPNQVEARVAGIGQVRSSGTVGSATAARTFTFFPRLLWFEPTAEGRVAIAIPRDVHGNAVQGDVTWTSRDPALVTVGFTSGTTAEVLVAGRPGRTYLVTTHGQAVDSVLVAVHDSSSSRCAFLADPVELPLGGSLPFERAGMACVRSNQQAEYVVIGHYNSPLASAASGIGVVAHGVAALGPPGASSGLVAITQPYSTDAEFENGLRARERDNMPGYAPAARAWYDARGRTPALAAVSKVGDQVAVNVNAFDFCTRPDERAARVAALTAGTIVLEDISNPPGGFTDAEYAAIAATMDTLVAPVNFAAFGEPTDIDGNGRIAILFTRAVNELTPRGSGAVVLGFYYSRDLLPRSGAAGACPGSNTAEIFYVMVPDPDAVRGDARTKGYVQGIAISTVAHELQHLINASRRMYVTRAQQTVEETWLNEGLSHIAEELVFYRASGLGPRQNIEGAQLGTGTRVRDMHELFMRGNFGRYAEFLEGTQSSSPMAGNDQLATRGASWAFLRYVADRAGAVDGDLWRRLVDGKFTGSDNLDAALAGSGMTAVNALHDWSAAVALDDLIDGIQPAHTQPSWHFSTSMPALGYRGEPAALVLRDAQPSSSQVRAGGSVYFRFGVDAGREALIQISSGGGVAPSGMRLTLARIK